MKRKSTSDIHSQDIVNYLLRSEGWTMTRIAKILKTGVPYISLVASGDRNLTVSHMQQLAKAVKMHFWELLLNATPVESVPKKHRQAYRGLVNVLRDVDRRDRLVRQAEQEHRAATAK